MKTIIANPPFSIDWDADNKNLLDLRFNEVGILPPKSKADFAFLLDMIYNLLEDGIMSVVLPHGILFRGAAEGKIRKWLIEQKNCLDAVIGLPANIFFGTSIPTCILIFKKNRNTEDGILFIDASNEFEKVKNKNLLTENHLNKIAETYHNKDVIEKYSHLATLKEIADNDYNLNIPRYVDTFQEQEEIDIQSVMQEIKSLECKRDVLDKEIDKYFMQLGLFF